MSCNLIVFIRKKDLEKVLPILNEEQYSDDSTEAAIAEYLLMKYNGEGNLKFDDLELIVCVPYNQFSDDMLRNKLTDWKVDFQTYYCEYV